MVMPTMSVNESGNCMAEPMSPLWRKGNSAKMVVSEVMTMGFSRRCPADQTAFSNGTPERYNLLMVSTFKMESLMMIPLMTTNPIMDMMFSDSPTIQSTSITTLTSMTISVKMMAGWSRLSNCAARMK